MPSCHQCSVDMLPLRRADSALSDRTRAREGRQRRGASVSHEAHARNASAHEATEPRRGEAMRDARRARRARDDGGAARRGEARRLQALSARATACSLHAATRRASARRRRTRWMRVAATTCTASTCCACTRACSASACTRSSARRRRHARRPVLNVLTAHFNRHLHERRLHAMYAASGPSRTARSTTKVTRSAICGVHRSTQCPPQEVVAALTAKEAMAAEKARTTAAT
jgi:hypothetical protein